MLQWTMLQQTVFINKIRMLQRTQMLQWTRRSTTGRSSTRVCMTCRAFPLWLPRHSSSLLSFVRFIYQFSSVICLYIHCKKVKLILYNFYTYIFDFVLYSSCLNGCVGWQLCSRLWAWNALPLNTYRSFATRVSQLKIWHFLVTGIERNLCRCTFNRL